MRILLVEDSKRLQTYIARGLRHQGFAVDQAFDGEEGLFLAESGDYDVVILDLMLPELDGFSLLQRLRERDVQTHVLILTARDAEADRIKGFDIGADDYLIKPFAFEELVARIQALLRRRYGVKTSVLRFGDLEINLSRREALKGRRHLPLRPREYALLELLALRQGAVVSRAEIERQIYDERVSPMSNVVDSAVCNLRKMIDTPGAPSWIETRRGMGYLFGEPQA